MLGACGRQLVEYGGKLISVCSPDYVLQNQPELKPVFGLALFVVLLGASIFFFKISRSTYLDYKDGKTKIGNLLAAIFLAFVFLYFSVLWLIYGIKSF